MKIGNFYDEMGPEIFSQLCKAHKLIELVDKKKISFKNQIPRSYNMPYLLCVCGPKIPPCSHRPIWLACIYPVSQK